MGAPGALLPRQFQQPQPQPVLDIQPGPKGVQVALTKARVRGDVLTVELQYGVGPSADNTPGVYTNSEPGELPALFLRLAATAGSSNGKTE